MNRKAAIVARQVEAYNRKDLDAFCACFADDIAVYDFPDTLILHGAQPFRARYQKRFAAPGTLEAEILNREQYGRFVVDTERLRGDAFGDADATVIYEVGEERIERCWFVREATI